MINFQQYHNDNPHVYWLFLHYAKRTKSKGFKNYSANGIFEIIRWHTGLKKGDVFKINNNYRPDYARKMMDEYPEFKGFFRVRTLKSKRK
jgi:hypothetical protein